MADSNSKTSRTRSSKTHGTKSKAARSEFEALKDLAARAKSADEQTAARSESKALKDLAARAKSADERAAKRSNPEELVEKNRRSLEAFVESNAAATDGMATLSAEILAFGNKRLNANLERSQSLVACEDAEQAFRVHYEFFESAVRQYQDQTNNMMTIMASMTRGLWAHLEEQSPAGNKTSPARPLVGTKETLR